MMDVAKKTMVPPFEISVFPDPAGSFTTAAAMVACTEKTLKDKFPYFEFKLWNDEYIDEFVKKHYNYFYALIKTFPNLLRAIKYYVLFRFKNDDYNSRLHKSELSGLFNAYLMKKSHYRPKIN